MTTPHDLTGPTAHEGTARREVLRAAGLTGGALAAAAALAACGGGGSGSGSAAGSGGNSTATPAGSVPTSKVPVGSGVIEDSLQAVVTQPTSGAFKAFDYLCTHEQCPLAQVSGAKIICDCHGSQFSIKDGSVLQGPATTPLTKKTATVKGSQVVIS